MPLNDIPCIFFRFSHLNMFDLFSYNAIVNRSESSCIKLAIFLIICPSSYAFFLMSFPFLFLATGDFHSDSTIFHVSGYIPLIVAFIRAFQNLYFSISKTTFEFNTIAWYFSTFFHMILTCLENLSTCSDTNYKSGNYLLQELEHIIT